MKILVLNYEYPPLGGGAAPVCRNLTTEMAKNGHRVTVVTMRYTGLPAYEKSGSVEIFRLKCLRARAHACMPWEQYSYILATKRFLRRLLRKRRYDVCHTHFVIPTGPIAEWVKKYYGIPYVLTAHGSDVEGYNDKTYMKIMHRFLRPAWRQIVKEAYSTVAPSGYLLQLMKNEFSGGHYFRISNGLDISVFQTDRSTKEKSILLMGRMQAAKNFQTVFRAIALISDTVWATWTVDVLGDGPYRSELMKLCAELGIESRVKFHGWVENGSTAQLDYLKKALVYISASHFENCPMAVLEAMAAGCYPLLSDIEGHRQFFSGREDRYFFKADDARGLSEKITLLLLQGLKECVVNGPDISTYDNARIAKEYLKLLEKAAKTTSEKPIQVH